MIKSVRIKHFKAIEDSGSLALGPLAVFVGHNGTGKSSVLEAMAFFQTLVLRGVGQAMDPWFDLNHVWWQGASRQRIPNTPFCSRPVEFQVRAAELQRAPFQEWSAAVRINQLAEDFGDAKKDAFVIQSEEFKARKLFRRRRNFDEPAVQNADGEGPPMRQPGPEESLLRVEPRAPVDDWMFLNLDPFQIAAPRALARGSGRSLDRSGANLARYLQRFLEMDEPGFRAMVDSLSYILPYAAGIESVVTRDLVDQRAFFQLIEAFPAAGPVKLPAWVLSGGTLRILTILACLRHPEPPSVLFVEEIENGLDPRALGFLVEEIKYAIESERTQVIATTHSPYLLDKLSLDHIITVDRPGGGPPVFSKASENKELKDWSERFAPGSLYTMGMFRKKPEGGEK